MKNDVVRWSSNNKNNNNNNAQYKLKTIITNATTSINEKQLREQRTTNSTSSNKFQQAQHVAATWQATEGESNIMPSMPAQQQQHITKTINSIRKCDKTNLNNLRNKNKISFLMQKLLKNNNNNINNDDDDDSSSLFSATKLTLSKVKSFKRSASALSTLNCPTTKTTTTTTTARNVFLFILQFSAVVFLCNLNVGFVRYAAAAINHGSSPNYVLDYELPNINHNNDNEANTLSGKQSSLGGSSSGLIDGHYTHTWAVHIPNGDNDGLANEVARDHGFINLGKIFDDHYHFAHHKVSKRSLSPAIHHQTRLDDDDRIHWAKQQTAKSRRKRDFIRMRPSRTSSRAMSYLVDAVPFDDPKWPHMWYLNRGGGLDMNVIPAWKQGITGKGIVVTILDDGLESDHPDIEKNYDPKASFDVNSHDEDPMPHYDMTDSNRHGTRCAGEVAATANNSICAVGIAYGASVGGVRMLDGDVTDAVEARSLSLNPQHIDIYSASWGPDDDGKTVDGPGELASRAFIEGTTKGRNGKGSIFIWASGNGGRELDNCNCDGYTNSIWTLSISSATEEGHVPWYSEKCSSTLATTYSSGGQSEKQVVTTDLHHSCTVSHTGTSASAPLAAGIAALVLESNSNLTWRDLQHIVVRTAKPANLKDPSWSKNGIGRRVSHSFGYGLMDAAEMVRVARNWKTVPEQQRCEINAPHVDKVIPPRTHITLQLSVKHCLSVNYLEHVQAKITLTSQRRGDIQLYLKSPAGTKVTLLTSRMHDISRSGFNQWPFMSVHTWGESPHGNWQLEIHNEGRYMGHALLREWSLIFYGSTQPIDPNDPVSVPRSNSAEITTPNSSIASTTTNLHQVYSPQYPRISPNNFGGGGLTNGGGKLPNGKILPNKSIYIPNGGITTNPLLGFIGGGGSGGANSGSAGSMPNKKQQQQQQQQQQLKQQTYQQISATYGVILASHIKSNGNNNNKGTKGGNKAKNGDNNNNNNNNNNKPNKNANGKGPNGNKKDSTTQSTPKNKYYRISSQQQQQQQQQQNNNGGGGNVGGSKSNNKSQNGVQMQRPKSQSSEKFYEDKTQNQRKIISGEILGNAMSIQNGANQKLTKISASQTATATSYSKLPIKATKQVKESKSHDILNQSNVPSIEFSPSNSSLLSSGSFASGSMESGGSDQQRIPAFFERYEKIQAIFPEFEHYDAGAKEAADKRGGKNTKLNFEVDTFKPFSTNSGTGGGGGTGAANGVNSGRNSANNGANGGGVSKPSRENSKKSPPPQTSSSSFVPDQKIIKKQQLLMAAAGVLSADNSQRALVVTSSNNNNNRKSTNAQITQWDLIFYGTETPAQPDDPEHLNTGQFSSYGNDMEHNDIEYDASGQWRNMQQVGESGVTRDRSNAAACLKWSDQRTCLACSSVTYLYLGICINECPIHTYPLLPSVTAATKSLSGETQTGNDNDLDNHLPNNGLGNGKYNELLAQDRRRRGDIEPELANTSNVDGKPTIVTRTCAICDNSCLRCHGPSAGECSTCYPGRQLRKSLLLNETRCVVYAVRSSGDVAEIYDANESNGSISKFATIMTVITVMIITGSLVGFTLYKRHTSRSANDLYTRVTLLRDGNNSASDADDDDDEEDDEEEEIFSATTISSPRLQQEVDTVLMMIPLTQIDHSNVNNIDGNATTIMAEECDL